MITNPCREYLASSAISGAGNAVGLQMREAIDQTETRATPLGSFPALFAQAMSLGILSRRRVFCEAQSLLEGDNLLRRLGVTQTTARSAVATADAADFHWHLAREDRLKDTRTGGAPRHWRWRVCIQSPILLMLWI